MARLARLCVPGWPHLLIQQGHNRQPVFRDSSDRQLFLDLLKAVSAAHGVAIHAYGLFDAQVRLLVTPSTADGLSLMMQAIGRRYGTYFNRRYNHAGGLWDGRFRTTVIEPERHLLSCMRFVEQPPLEVDSSTALGQESWSSAAHHLGQKTDPVINDHLQYWSLGNTPFEREAVYGEISKHPLTLEEVRLISDAARKGWPMGSSGFLAQISAMTDRRLRPLTRGRPPKADSPKSDPNKVV